MASLCTYFTPCHSCFVSSPTQESWWRQCVSPDGRVVQPVAVQRMAAALGGLWSSSVGDGTAAAELPQRQPLGAGSAGEGAACAEYR